ncbi:phosphorylase family protein [Micromonospora deserti]|uniref:phosphorylase family protein n=1 Tax=Micromonospora deserti TaxID=2070366 RepID=UPI001314C361|nr:hypothetical protein [Micromonospora deserti]
METLNPAARLVLEGSFPCGSARDGLADNRSVTLPEPVGATHQAALNAIWDLLLRGGRWPTFQELDQHLYRVYDLDAARLLPELPPGLLHGVDPGSIMPIAQTTTIGLTAAGAGATGRAERELDLFLTVVHHAVALERDYDSPADQPYLQPGLVSADVAALLELTLPEDAALLKRLGAILYTERWGWTSFGGLGTDVWEVRVGREVRRFRHAPDIATYWKLRPKHWVPDKPAPAAKRSVVPSTPTMAFLEPVAEYGSAPEQQGTAAHAARDSALNHYGGDMDRVDVLVIAALPEEFDAAKAAGLASAPAGPGVLRWENRDLDGVPPFLWGEYHVDGKPRFTVALARPTQMGGRATGPFAASLADRLRPASLAMCGVCAGNATDTALGDVVVGEPVYEWDEGKQSASGFEGDHRQFRLLPRWLRAAQDFDPTRLASYGDASEGEASLWFLEQLHRGQQPRSHPARDAYFPRGTWQRRLAQLEEQGLIRREPTGEAVLTSDGSDLVQRRLYDDADGPQRLPFRVLAAPMASGSAVVADPDVWGRLKAMGMRKITAVEMESATIATVAHDRELAWLVAKGVMDHADTRKDDRYKKFAARASAQVMFALLERLLTKTEAVTQRITEMVGTAEISNAYRRGGADESRARVTEPARVDVVPLLDELAADDPVPDNSARTNGRLYLVAHPVDAAADALAGVSTMSASGDLDALIRQAVAARGGQPFAPDLDSGMWRRRSSGMAKENGIRDDGSVREDSLLVLKVRENGTVGVLCGRATAMARSQWRPLGSAAEPAEHRVIFPSLVLGLVHGALCVAGDLANRYAGYDGRWVIGLRLTGVKTAIAYEYVQNGDADMVQPYDADTYQRTATASTADLIRTPDVLTEQLVGALLRGLSVDKRYLPYAKSASDK